MKHAGALLSGASAISVCLSTMAAADTSNPVVPELGDRLGEHLGLATYLFLGAAAVLLIISIVSVIRRK